MSPRDAFILLARNMLKATRSHDAQLLAKSAGRAATGKSPANLSIAHQHYHQPKGQRQRHHRLMTNILRPSRIGQGCSGKEVGCRLARCQKMLAVSHGKNDYSERTKYHHPFTSFSFRFISHYKHMSNMIF